MKVTVVTDTELGWDRVVSVVNTHDNDKIVNHLNILYEYDQPLSHEEFGNIGIIFHKVVIEEILQDT